jgi:cephalosporin hydroxylase
MNVFWKSIIEPLLECAKPSVLVEVGCHQGKNTRNLVSFCQEHHCDLHVIDPRPELNPVDLAQWQTQRDFGFVLHKARSLDVLPRISRADVVLLDGDHNWYTVFHELQALKETALGGVGKPPLVLLHDIGWPYARRDLYYDPGAIPNEYRQPYSQQGIHPKFNGQTGQQGFNVGANNALQEGGPRNGVLTAVEDYLASTDHEYIFIQVPLYHGLGILCPRQLVEWNEDLAAFLEQFRNPLLTNGLLDAIEEERLSAGIDLEDTRRVTQTTLDLLESRTSDEADLLLALEEAVTLLFQSKRWRIGSAIVDGLRSVLRLKKGYCIKETLDQIVTAGKERRVQKQREQELAAQRKKLAVAAIQPLIPHLRTPADITRDFHRLYYDNARQTWEGTYWLGTRVLKCPLDLWLYQELIQQTRPDLIVETGTFQGGSALFMASICEQLGHGEVLTIDVAPQPDRPRHPRLRYRTGSSIDQETLQHVQGLASQAQRVMVILDSDHCAKHVLAELRAYAPLVTQDCYLIVEDTNVNGYPVREDHGPGPREALTAFLKENHDFAIDSRQEKFFLTFNPGGFLRRLTPRSVLKGEEACSLAGR